MQENTKKVIEYLNNGTQFNANEVALLMNIYMYTSMILCFNRVHIKSNELEFPSLMGVYFAPSGAYKDRPLSLLENATNEVLEFQEKQKKEIYRKIVIKNESFAESFDSKKQKNDFLKENKPRYFKDKMTGGTYQGLQTERLACLKMGIGHIHFSHGEFLDAITSPSAKTSDILMKIKEIDYSGKSSSDSIKSEETEDVVGVPLTFMVHGSVDHIYSNDNIKQKLLNVLDGGYERRCFINFSKNTKRDDSLTFMQAEKMRKYCENNMQEISNIFMNIQKNIVQSIYGDKKLEIKIPIDCREQLHEYQMFCSSLANKTKSKHKRTELNDRAMRARVLSVCIAMLEHPNDPIVNLSDIGDAITFADRCGDNFTKFIDYNGDSITEILFDKILKKPRTKTQIRNIINKNGDSYRLRMKGLQIYEKELEEFCIDNDMVLSKETQERGKTIYSIEKLQEISEELIEEKLTILVGNSNQEDCKIFEEKSIKFESLHKIVCAKNKYMAGTLNGGRCQKNWTCKDNILMFDIDNDDAELKIEEAKEIFRKYKFALFTTKRHQVKEKGMKDRYRLIFPTKQLKNLSIVQYKLLKKEFQKHFKIDRYCDDPANLNPTTHWAAHDGEYFYNDSKKIINWEFFKKEEKKKKVYKQTKLEPQNIRPQQVFELKNGEIVDWEYFTQKTPVKCTEPNHEDKNPSAFVAINDKGNKFFKCSICNILYFNQ